MAFEVVEFFPRESILAHTYLLLDNKYPRQLLVNIDIRDVFACRYQRALGVVDFYCIPSVEVYRESGPTYEAFGRSSLRSSIAAICTTRSADSTYDMQVCPPNAECRSEVVDQLGEGVCSVSNIISLDDESTYSVDHGLGLEQPNIFVVHVATHAQ